MIGKLPKSLIVAGKKYDIRADYRIALNIFCAMTDPDLTELEARIVVISTLYVNPDFKTEEEIIEALEKAYWFLSLGDEKPNNTGVKIKYFDWEQDEQIIFSAINKVANRDVRECDYMHYWTFMGYFNEIGEGSFSTIVSIRSKLSKGKKLEKYEQEYYRNNKNSIDLKVKLSEAQIEQKNELNKLLGIK